MKYEAMVSICMITYGHENYIEEAISSVLVQDCDFTIELILANDCSLDFSDEIIQNLIKLHPKGNLIKYFKHEKNIGMMPNFIFALQQCKGKYIAICDGDDFWIDPQKLRKQVDFLEKNADYSLCFHNAEVHNHFANSKYLFLENYTLEKFKINDIFEKWIIPTASMVFRNDFGSTFPEFFKESTHGDLALQLYLSKFGKIKGFEDVMSVYRINQSSVTTNHFSSYAQNNKHIKQLKLMNAYFDSKFDYDIQKRIFLFRLINANTFKNKSSSKQLYWICKAIVSNPRHIMFYKAKIKENLINVLKTMKYFLQPKTMK